MSLQQSHTTPRAAQPIRLQIAGGELLLNGNFANWTPLMVDDTDPDIRNVQILIDITSHASSGANTSPSISFKGNKVFKRKDAFIVNGVLDVSGVRSTHQISLRIPEGHTPFCILALSLAKNDHRALWSTFEEAMLRTNIEGQEMRATAWLRPPDVAAA